MHFIVVIEILILELELRFILVMLCRTLSIQRLRIELAL